MGGIHQVAVLRSYVTTASMLGMNCGAPLGAILTDRIGWKWSGYKTKYSIISNDS